VTAGWRQTERTTAKELQLLAAYRNLPAIVEQSVMRHFFATGGWNAP
jgi:hypothetical protein